MYIEVRGEGGQARAVLNEPDDCQRFKVVIDGSVDEAALAAALAGIGRPVGRETVWVRPEAVRRLAAGRVDVTWDASFDRMVEFARTKGWVDESSTGARGWIRFGIGDCVRRRVLCRRHDRRAPSCGNPVRTPISER
jgi:hypothetical protein